MDLLTISGIILAACGALILGMAGLLKGMVLGKIQDIQIQLEVTAASVAKVIEVEVAFVPANE